MHPALQGALIGLGLGAVLTLFEYIMLSKAANERAKKFNRKAEFDMTDRARMSTIMRFALVLPVGFAFVFWWVWG
ncbi:MAG TPA: hypothetical protein VGJ74_09355 [Burkholderiales bacterium]|jgi:hypothetical protein